MGANLGYDPGTILPLPDSLPLLLLGGTDDGVIANNSHRYGVEWEEATTPISRTFQEAIAGGRGDSYVVLLQGANHFCITESDQSLTSTVFLDFPSTKSERDIRSLFAEVIGLFIEGHICQLETSKSQLQTLLNSDNSLLKMATWK